MSKKLKRNIMNINHKHKQDNNYTEEGIDYSQIPYCENPAIGMGAPKCSDDCCRYGSCHKYAYFEHVTKNNNNASNVNRDLYQHDTGLYTCHKCGAKVEIAYFDGENGPVICKTCKDKNKDKNKIAIGTNRQFDKFVIEDREYSKEEVLEILKKHKAEEDKKYHKCYRCNKKYLENNRFNMVKNNLEQSVCNPSAYAIGYQTTPYITGFKILSKCGHGKDIGLCDDCIEELISWLGEFNYK